MYKRGTRIGFSWREVRVAGMLPGTSAAAAAGGGGGVRESLSTRRRRRRLRGDHARKSRPQEAV